MVLENIEENPVSICLNLFYFLVIAQVLRDLIQANTQLQGSAI